MTIETKIDKKSEIFFLRLADIKNFNNKNLDGPKKTDLNEIFNFYVEKQRKNPLI